MADVELLFLAVIVGATRGTSRACVASLRQAGETAKRLRDAIFESQLRGRRARGLGEKKIQHQIPVVVEVMPMINRSKLLRESPATKARRERVIRVKFSTALEVSSHLGKQRRRFVEGTLVLVNSSR